MTGLASVVSVDTCSLPGRFGTDAPPDGDQRMRSKRSKRRWMVLVLVLVLVLVMRRWMAHVRR